MRGAGILGIVAGGTLLSGVLPSAEFPTGVHAVRLVLYFLGSAAVAWATRRADLVGPSPGAAAVVAAVVALSGLSAGLVLLDRTGAVTPTGTLGVAAFWMSVATWIATSAFGLLLVRRPAPAGVGGLALAIGSVLAILGIDRVGLTSGTQPTIAGTAALAGVALVGIGWILLGLRLVLETPRPAARAA